MEVNEKQAEYIVSSIMNNRKFWKIEAALRQHNLSNNACQLFAELDFLNRELKREGPLFFRQKRKLMDTLFLSKFEIESASKELLKIGLISITKGELNKNMFKINTFKYLELIGQPLPDEEYIKPVIREEPIKKEKPDIWKPFAQFIGNGWMKDFPIKENMGKFWKDTYSEFLQGKEDWTSEQVQELISKIKEHSKRYLIPENKFICRPSNYLLSNKWEEKKEYGEKKSFQEEIKQAGSHNLGYDAYAEARKLIKK